MGGLFQPPLKMLGLCATGHEVISRWPLETGLTPTAPQPQTRWIVKLCVVQADLTEILIPEVSHGLGTNTVGDVHMNGFCCLVCSDQKLETTRMSNIRGMVEEIDTHLCLKIN